MIIDSFVVRPNKIYAQQLDAQALKHSLSGLLDEIRRTMLGLLGNKFQKVKLLVCVASISVVSIFIMSRLQPSYESAPVVKRFNRRRISKAEVGFVSLGGDIFYLSDRGEAHVVSSCQPCGVQRTLCQQDAPGAASFIRSRDISAASLGAFPSGAPFECAMAPHIFPEAISSARLGIGLYTGFATYIGGVIYYVDGNQKYHSESCRPCGPSFTICEDNKMPKSAFIPPLAALKKDVDNLQDGGKFKCRMAPQYFKGYLQWHRVPLLLELDASQPVRLNVLMTGLGKDLTGGPLSIIRFLDQILKRTQLSVRWINVDGAGIAGDELRDHLQKYPSTEVFRKRVGFVFDGAREIDQPKLLTNPRDMFMSTLYFTALMAHSTIQQYSGLRNRNHIYFIQDFEPIFFPHDANHLEALESYRYPHFAIYSTFFLEKWFTEKGYGQGQFIRSASLRNSVSYASEPAIKPWLAFNKSLFSNPSRTRKVIVYARSHADRNAYELTIDTLSAAVCEGVFDKENWEVIGVGASFDYNEYLGRQCGRHMRMVVRENIPENEYRKMVSSGDVGVSLMVSPHPSLPPFDFAAAGLITLTNSFATKTEQMFKSVSSNFVVAEPYLPDLLDGLSTAISRSRDLAARAAGATLNWESQWDGARCYGPDLMAKVLTWFEHTENLW